MNNALFCSMKPYSLVEVIRSHSKLYVERKKTIEDLWLYHEAVSILVIFSVKTYKNMIAFVGLERTQERVCIEALSLY